jgi:hypothetical protein
MNTDRARGGSRYATIPGVTQTDPSCLELRCSDWRKELRVAATTTLNVATQKVHRIPTHNVAW